MKSEFFKLSQSTIEKLRYYVYLLIDPRNNEVFYVGKGKGNRIYQHLLGTLKNPKENQKNRRIIEIKSLGLEIQHHVLRHGMSENEAFEVESAIIDYIGLNKLTNIVKGHYTDQRGMMTLEDIKLIYEAKEIYIEEPILLININNLYRKGMSQEEIYQATRKSWKINLERAKKIKICCSVYKGIIREVFIMEKWQNTQNSKRKEFFGKIAPENIREKYLNRSVVSYWKKGSQNPLKYIYPEK